MISAHTSLQRDEIPFDMPVSIVTARLKILTYRYVKLCVPASIHTAMGIAISTGPYFTSLARLLHATRYCSLHMLVTTPLPKFFDSLVPEHRTIAPRKSTRRTSRVRRSYGGTFRKRIVPLIIYGSSRVLKLRNCCRVAPSMMGLNSGLRGVKVAAAASVRTSAPRIQPLTIRRRSNRWGVAIRAPKFMLMMCVCG